MSLADVACFKIHPAIGVARIANNESWFEFFDAHAKAFSPPQDYMSVDASDSSHPQKPRMKRQAVQFKVFAYKSNGDLIGEVSQLFPDLRVHWTAEVGNRKVHNYTSKRGTGILDPVNAKATASLPSDTASLDGINPWDPGATVHLGSISGTGLFIPAKGGVTRKSQNSQIDRYPANESGALECSDSTCDGSISVTLFDQTGTPVNLPVIGAWIVSAPSKHCLTLTPDKAEEMAENFGDFLPSNNNANRDWIKSTKALLGIVGDIADPTGLDIPMMETMNADYNPGMEVNIEGVGRLENGIHPTDFFYSRGTGHIGANEVRIQPKSERPNATQPGQITSGLCSTWQGDMVACLNYWTAENPNRAFDLHGDEKIVIYRESNPNATMNTPEEINANMDFRGIVEHESVGNDIRLNLVYDPNRP
ncbi:MAG: LodA/GoxA family CTQ-dependent oxidase [Planctomycetaceae bacterium]|nr:LodA/GoxA family CTQ-dependent oxidase [Planctomycetaceae bacterium]